jgi:hypothetical protein
VNKPEVGDDRGREEERGNIGGTMGKGSSCSITACCPH